jgi:hypothetical protein
MRAIWRREVQGTMRPVPVVVVDVGSEDSFWVAEARGDELPAELADRRFIRGATRFQRRGLAACRAEWKLLAATHNLLKLWRAGLAHPAPARGETAGLPSPPEHFRKATARLRSADGRAAARFARQPLSRGFSFLGGLAKGRNRLYGSVLEASRLPRRVRRDPHPRLGSLRNVISRAYGPLAVARARRSRRDRHGRCWIHDATRCRGQCPAHTTETISGQLP